MSTKLKPGYKSSPFGVVPDDWDVLELGQTVNENRPISYGIVQTGELVEGGVRCIRVTDIVDGKIDTSNLITTSKKISDSYKRTLLKKGDLVMALRGKIGQIALIDDSVAGANLTRGVAIIDLKKSYNSDFMKQQISSDRAIKIFEKSLNGSALQELSIGVLRKIPVLMPKDYSEQTAIANLLSSWDKAISNITKLIVQKELRKKWLMQQLLTGKTRLKGFNEQWRFIKFGEIYEPVKERVGNRKYLPLSVTKSGIVSQADYFNKQIQSEDTSAYLVVRKGNMVMSGLNFWMGAIDVMDQFDAGIVSPAYKAFEIKNSSISPTFMKFFIRSNVMLRALIGSSVQGASIVRRNLDKETLDEWAFHFPLKKEQEAIAKVLQSADQELILLRQKLDKLKEQKKGLMQVLLTGKIRLKL